MVLIILLHLRVESASVHRFKLAIHLPRHGARIVGFESNRFCHLSSRDGGMGVPACGGARHRAGSQQDGPTQGCQQRTGREETAKLVHGISFRFAFRASNVSVDFPGSRQGACAQSNGSFPISSRGKCTGKAGTEKPQ